MLFKKKIQANNCSLNSILTPGIKMGLRGCDMSSIAKIHSWGRYKQCLPSLLRPQRQTRHNYTTLTPGSQWAWQGSLRSMKRVTRRDGFPTAAETESPPLQWFVATRNSGNSLLTVLTPVWGDVIIRKSWWNDCFQVYAAELFDSEGRHIQCIYNLAAG